MPFLGLQTSFTAGELSPSLSVRVDLSRYQSGCKKLENMLVHPHGGVSKRNGLRYLGALPGKARLMPFVFSVIEAYVLVWAEKRLYIFDKHGAVLNWDGSVYSIASPYSAEEAKQVSFVQSADVIYLASTKHTPYRLSRHNHTDWRLEQISFAPKASPPVGVLCGLHDVRTEDERVSDGEGEKDWVYVVTKVNNKGEESLPCASVQISGPENLRPTCYPKLWWPTSASSGDSSEYRIYQDKNGKYGYIGSSVNYVFDAKNIAPDMGDCPPENVNPFAGGNYPGAVCFFQQRLVFGGSEKNPQTLWFSRTGNYESFNKSSPAKPDDAMEISIAGNEVSRIEWLVALRTLLVGTSGTEWEVKSSGAALSAADISIVPQSYRGSAKLPALVVGNSVLHVSRTNREMRDLLYDFGTDSYAGSDHAILASHLFENNSIVDWAYQQSPNSIIWCVRSDGVLLGHTYLREHQVFAWHRHMTQGSFESICTIPGKYEDDLFAVVRRKINGRECYYLERMENNFSKQSDEENTRDEASDRELDPEINNQLFFADAALSYHGVAISKVIGLDHLLGEEVCIVADGAVCANQIVRDLSLDGLAQGFSQESSQKAFRGMENGANTELGQDFSQDFSQNLDKDLEEKTGNMLGNTRGNSDSNKDKMRAVRNSNQVGVKIPFDAKKIVIGLPYRARLQSMPLEADTGEGSSVGRKKCINRVGVYFKDTNSARIGTDFDAPYSMDEVKWRLSEKPGEAIKMHSEDAWIYTNGVYLNQTHACVESSVPLPCTILAIIPEISISAG